MVSTAFNVEAIRKQFPTLHQEVNGKKLVYFDNGATSQTPQSVIDAIDKYYKLQNANIHRGVHTLSQEATDLYEQARVKVQQYINAAHSHEIIFTKGTTDAINLVSHTFSKKFLNPGDEVIISALEHHSNIVPWQMACEFSGAILKVIPMNHKGELEMEKFDDLLSTKTKIVAVNHVSNALGTINPVEEIIYKSHQVGAKVLIDGAQWMPHQKLDVQELNADFYVFSTHKTFGPTGVGFLYGKETILNELPPYQGGGDMIKTVTFEKTTYNELPHKFEAGTPHISGGIACGAMIDFMNSLDWDAVAAHEKELLDYATEKLSKIEGIQFYGQAKHKEGVISFLVDGVHPFDVGTLLDKLGVAVRTGHHCTQPIMDYYQIPGTIRASFSIYNTIEEIDYFIESLNRILPMLK